VPTDYAETPRTDPFPAVPDIPEILPLPADRDPATVGWCTQCHGLTRGEVLLRYRIAPGVAAEEAVCLPHIPFKMRWLRDERIPQAIVKMPRPVGMRKTAEVIAIEELRISLIEDLAACDEPMVASVLIRQWRDCAASLADIAAEVGR
jgi:hypothetical protein